MYHTLLFLNFLFNTLVQNATPSEKNIIHRKKNLQYLHNYLDSLALRCLCVILKKKGNKSAYHWLGLTCLIFIYVDCRLDGKSSKPKMEEKEVQ